MGLAHRFELPESGVIAMWKEENFRLALLVTAFGLIVYFIIPIQVSSAPVPGSMGLSKVGPATLPRVSAWGFIITGLAWMAFEVGRFLKARRGVRERVASIEGTAGGDGVAALLFPLGLWLAVVICISLLPMLGFAESCTVLGIPLGLAMARARPKRFQRGDWIALGVGMGIFPLILHFLFRRFLYVDFPGGIISQFLTGW